MYTMQEVLGKSQININAMPSFVFWGMKILLLSVKTVALYFIPHSNLDRRVIEGYIIPAG